jgi:phage terminase large subunit-like protein
MLGNRISKMWPLLARAAQLPPEGDWRVWLLMGGRGAGKTRAGAEWMRALVESGRARRVALVGPTLLDVREVMIEGASGLKAASIVDLVLWLHMSQHYGYLDEHKMKNISRQSI